MANDLKSWAEAGARARLLDIHTETATILRIFPELRKRAAATIRRRRTMSQAERKAVGERMRKYWAARRQAKAAAPAGGAAGTRKRRGKAKAAGRKTAAQPARTATRTATQTATKKR